MEGFARGTLWSFERLFVPVSSLFRSSSRCPGVMSDFDLFVSSTGNLNINTFDPMKTNILFVGDTGHFHNENCLAGFM